MSMFSKFNAWLNGEEPVPNETFTNLDSVDFHYVNEDGVKTGTITMTFVLGSNDTRDVILDYNKTSLYGNNVTNHPFYHSRAIPWLRKTAWASTDNAEHLKSYVEQICAHDKPIQLDTPPEKPEPKSKDGNVLTVDFGDS